MANPNGAPKKEFKWDVLDAILRYKATQKDCMELLGVSIRTIERKIKEAHDMTFGEYRDLKMSRTRMKLAQKQFDSAMAGNTALLTWLGKQWLGQTDRQEHDIGENAANILKVAYKLDK